MRERISNAASGREAQIKGGAGGAIAGAAAMTDRARGAASSAADAAVQAATSVPEFVSDTLPFLSTLAVESLL